MTKIEQNAYKDIFKPYQIKITTNVVVLFKLVKYFIKPSVNTTKEKTGDQDF